MSQPHIMILDDVKTSTTIMSISLTRADYRVTAQNNSVKALGWLRITDDPPDLIVSDLNMPEMNGATFVKRVRTIDRYAKTPIIMLTAHSRKELVVASLEAGVSAYLIKPISNHELITRVDDFLRKKTETEEDLDAAVEEADSPVQDEAAEQ